MKRAGVADADPADEVDDGERPRHRHVDAPDADARVTAGSRCATPSSASQASANAKPASQRDGPPLQRDRDRRDVPVIA